MYFWDGTNWVEPSAPAQPRRESRAANWAATGLMLLVMALFVVPFSTTFAAARMGSLAVSFDGSTATGTSSTVQSSSSSIFTGSGCSYRANSSDYYMVVKGPAPDTKSVSYWVDPFPTNRSGCGSATVSWTGSGVAGDFDVYVVRSASGNPWQAQPVSNVVTITIQ